MEGRDTMKLVNFRKVIGHPFCRALADIQIGGFLLRGFKLEGDELSLGCPGRKVAGAWQLVSEPLNQRTKAELRALLVAAYERTEECKP